ncbi:hypothetical protein [Desulfosediminicola sp.]|uniref:hypothetical protein n=1 Tax=Desulfosediminicola sp. TaxID=2886825 RepID=UPI003AF2A493
MEHLERYRGIHVIFAITLFIGAVVLLLPPQTSDLMIKEDGPIEMLSAIGYLIAAGWLFNGGFQKRLSHGFSSGTIVLFLGLRELDFHTRFTTMGIFKTRFFISDTVPPMEKAIVSLIVIAMLLGLFLYARKHLPQFIAGLKSKGRTAISIACAIGLAVFSKTLDRNSDLIMDCVALISSIDITQLLRVAEETSELAIPLFILLAISYSQLNETEPEFAPAIEH